MHLDHFGIVADELAGDLFAEGKAAAPGIGVTNGPCSADELRAAGASYVLPDLVPFPELLTEIAVGP